MSPDDFTAFWITFKLATITSCVLIVIGTPLAWWLARTRHIARVFIEPIVALPIVLPPTVLGFYFLILFSPQNPLGEFWIILTGTPLSFTFTALVIGSVIYSLPFYVQPLQVAFEGLDPGLLDTAATLGANPLDRFFSLAVPLSRKGFIVAICLAFAHTVGEFGIVLMIGGNIPGETQVLSIALFDHVESLEYQSAHMIAGILLIFSFLLLTFVYSLNRKWTIKTRRN